jgi:hypothetical protein
MASILSFLRKTMKSSTRAVRRVGKATRSVVRKGTNTLGLTRKARKGGKGKRR